MTLHKITAAICLYALRILIQHLLYLVLHIASDVPLLLPVKLVHVNRLPVFYNYM